jgi:hypothetical protein
VTKKRKPIKPKLEGWNCSDIGPWGNEPTVYHSNSGRWWSGTKKLKAMGKYFIKVAEYYEALGK